MAEKIFSDMDRAVAYLTNAAHNALCVMCPPDFGAKDDPTHRHPGDAEHTIVAAALTRLPSLLRADGPDATALRRVLGLKWETERRNLRTERVTVRQGVHEYHVYVPSRLVGTWEERLTDG